MEKLPPEIIQQITGYLVKPSDLYNLLCTCRYLSIIIPITRFFTLEEAKDKKYILEFNRSNIRKLVYRIQSLKENIESPVKLSNLEEFVITSDIASSRYNSKYVDIRRITDKKKLNKISIVFERLYDFNLFYNMKINLCNIKVDNLVIHNSCICTLIYDKNTFIKSFTLKNECYFDIENSSYENIKMLPKVKSFFRRDINLPYSIEYTKEITKKIGNLLISIEYCNLKQRSYNETFDSSLGFLVDRSSLLIKYSNIKYLKYFLNKLDKDILQEVYFEGAVVLNYNEIDLREFKNLRKLKLKLCHIRNVYDYEFYDFDERYEYNENEDNQNNFTIAIVSNVNNTQQMNIISLL